MVRNTAKIVLLIFGLLPIVLFILAFAILEPGVKTKSTMFDVLAIPTAISIPGVFIIYLVTVYKSKHIAEEQKHLWAALLFFGNVLVYHVYWYLHIWRKVKQV
jgi:hypothetical protein